MGGFVSTSLNLQESIFHALKNDDKNMKSVLMHIEWKASGGHFRLNTKEYSAMHYEKEVLLNDGLKFDIVEVIDGECCRIADKGGKEVKDVRGQDGPQVVRSQSLRRPFRRFGDGLAKTLRQLTKK